MVAEQEPDWDSPIAEIHRGSPRLLRHPRRVRACRDPGRDDPPGAQLDEEQHVQRLQPVGLHREQVARHDPLGLARRNCAQLGPERRGAGPRPRRRSSVLMVVAPTRMPSLRSSPQILMRPHWEFPWPSAR
jgi:hypothetical protein